MLYMDYMKPTLESFEDYKRRVFKKDRALKEEYDRLGPEFAVIEMIIEKRIKEGLTQAELARRAGTKQSAIARLESGTYNPTISFLQKIAEALGTRLKVSFPSLSR